MLLRFLAAATLVTVIASGCGGSSDEAGAPQTSEATQTATEAPSGHPPASPIAGTSLDGESISLGDFRGRPVLVNVWSSW